MSLREDLARNGNGKAIMRMNSEGMGKNQIAGVFKDNRIPAVTAKVVQCVIESHEALGTKALPREATRDAINAHRGSQNLGSADGLAPT